MLKKTAFFLFALLLAMSAIEIGANLIGSGNFGFGRPAEARIGRPLTPFSVAGVGRRTVRRCVVGVYYC